MQTMLHIDERDDLASSLLMQLISMSVHTGLALGSWLALMLVGYIYNPVGIPQTLILGSSVLLPFVMGNLINRFRQDEMATLIWLVGLIWILLVSLWILDMPTGPNLCFQCDASEKLARSFFSLPQPSGLIDNDAPFLGTWPSAALFGYAIGARLALRRRPQSEE